MWINNKIKIYTDVFYKKDIKTVHDTIRDSIKLMPKPYLLSNDLLYKKLMNENTEYDSSYLIKTTRIKNLNGELSFYVYQSDLDYARIKTYDKIKSKYKINYKVENNRDE